MAGPWRTTHAAESGGHGRLPPGCPSPVRFTPMLAILDRGHARNCQGLSRREFLRIGSLTLGLSGLSLPGLLASQARAGAGASSAPKAVVLLFLQGGPTQHETWDPKPDAPQEYRTIVDCVSTALPGVS